MRSIATLLALALLVPAPALAQRERRDRDRDRDRSEERAAPAPRRERGDSRARGTREAPRPDGVREAPRRSRARGVAPAPGVRAAPAPRPWYYGRRHTYPRYYGYPTYAPFWYGWGWGWGYYPLYPRAPRPAYAGYDQGPQADPSERIATRLQLHGAGGDGGVGGLALAVDGREAGFHVGVDAVAFELPDGTTPDDAFAWGSAHLTWSVVSSAAGRVRLELGGSMLAMPDTYPYAGRPYAGTVAFGPDVGFSAQLGLLGPIGLEGHARYTPWPVPVADLRAAVALRGGPFALTMGVRTIDVQGEEDEGPDARFSGPELGLSVIF